MSYYAGVPVGLPLDNVPPGRTATFSTVVPEYFVFTRLRWAAPCVGLVLINAFAHKTNLAPTDVPVLELGERGTWRFPALLTPASVRIGVVVRNVQSFTGTDIRPSVIAFWGMRFDQLPRDQQLKMLETSMGGL